jgi:hypothetical protein
MLTVRAQPGMRRVLDAFESTFKEDAERCGENAAALPDWREALIRAQHKVIDFYREVLATHDMPQAERASIENRIARIESELAGLQEAPNRFHRPAVPHQQAA